MVSRGDRISITESVPVAQKRRGESRRAIVIGDSIVRGTDRRFCGSERDSRMVCCLPGARVRDVSDRVFRSLKGDGEQSQVVVHIGTNYIGKRRDGDLKQEFRELGWKLRGKGWDCRAFGFDLWVLTVHGDGARGLESGECCSSVQERE